MRKPSDKPHDANIRIARIRPDIFAKLKKEAYDNNLSVASMILMILAQRYNDSEKGS